MKCKITGLAEDGTVTGPISLTFEVDPGGETLPPLSIGAQGGTLNVNKSEVSTWGTVSFHLFRSSSDMSKAQKPMEAAEVRAKCQAAGLSAEHCDTCQMSGIPLSVILGLISQAPAVIGAVQQFLDAIKRLMPPAPPTPQA